VQLGEKIRSMPLVRVFLPFLAGIMLALQSELIIGFIPVLISGILLITALFLDQKFPDRNGSVAIPGLLLVFFLLIGFYITNDRQKRVQPVEMPEKALLVAEIVSPPRETEKSVGMDVRIRAYRHKDNWYSGEDKARVYLQKDSMAKALKPGSLISFKPDFNSITNPGNPAEFDYADYMAYHMIASSAYLKSGTWKLIDPNHTGSLQQKLMRWRNKLLNVYREVGLKDDEFAVAAALSLGYKDKLQDKVRHAYSASGAMHVLAVSGLHVGIIFLVLQFVLSPMKKSKRLNYLRVLFIILAIWFYAMLTGMSPSVTRAAIMFSFISAGSLFRQHINIYNILAASAFVTLFINPFALTELGFWLSYLAVLSIVTFYQPIYRLIRCKYKLTDKLWSLIAVSIAAQIGTAPLTIMVFHQFSNYFILTNIVVIPIVTLVVYLAILVFVLSAILPAVAVFAGKVLALLIEALNESVFFIEQLPGSVSEGLYLSLPSVILLYAFIILASVVLLGGKRHFVWPALAVMILFVSFGIWRDYKSMENKTFLVYNLRKHTAVNCIVGNDNILFSDFSRLKKADVTGRMENHWLREGVEKEKYVDLSKSGSQYLLSTIMSIDNPHVFMKNLFVGFDDLRVLIIRDDRYRNVESDTQIKLDYLIISAGAELDFSTMNRLFDVKKVIIDASVPWYNREDIRDDLTKNGIEYYDVAEDGAFILNL